MKHPEECNDDSSKVCRLTKKSSGLKQNHGCWNEKFNNYNI